MKKIEIEHFIDGRTVVEAHGYNGYGCIEATREIEDLHGCIVERQMKNSFYESFQELTESTKFCG